jgi:hypothetical protein
VGEDEGARTDRGAGIRCDHDAVARELGVNHCAVPNLDVGMPGELLAAGLAELEGGSLVLAEQPSDRPNDRIRRAARVEHEHALSGSAEHECGAQPRGPASDDHHVERGGLVAAIRQGQMSRRAGHDQRWE